MSGSVIYKYICRYVCVVFDCPCIPIVCIVHKRCATHVGVGLTSLICAGSFWNCYVNETMKIFVLLKGESCFLIEKAVPLLIENMVSF